MTRLTRDEVFEALESAVFLIADGPASDKAWRAKQALTQARATIAALYAERDALHKALTDLVDDLTDIDHEPNDWSEQVCIRQARAALAPQP